MYKIRRDSYIKKDKKINKTIKKRIHKIEKEHTKPEKNI
jgi:hypothetical protein